VELPLKRHSDSFLDTFPVKLRFSKQAPLPRSYERSYGTSGPAARNDISNSSVYEEQRLITMTSDIRSENSSF